MEYLDFSLKIGPRVAENEYAVAARSSAIGEAGGVFARPLTDEQLELFVLKVGLARRGVRRIGSPQWRAAQDFGQTLFRSLFTNEIRAAYLASHNDAVRQSKGLRVKLTLDAPELVNYPWEFLYDPSTSQFLSLFEDTPILRYVELARPILPLTVTPPLRILAMASSPKDYEPLDLARERRNLAQAVAPLLQAALLEIDWLALATLDALREQLLKRTYHIFHFIGHGGFDDREQDGVLIFENANQYANRVSGERLAVVLGNHRTLRLAILNACEGARTSEQDPFAGTALTLVRTGNLPAVIAMQFEISDIAAIQFASGFYSALAANRPVDAAVSQGRQAIFTNDNDVEWSTPVLYLRAADGVIFQVDTNRAAEDAERIAAEQAEQERLAREKLEAERVAAEQAAAAEKERLENERLEQERAAREKAAAELAAAALLEKERVENARLEQERVAREQQAAQPAEQVQGANVPLQNLAPERAAPAALAASDAPATEPIASTRQSLAAQNQLWRPLLLAEIVWTLGMGFLATAHDLTTNVVSGVILAILLTGIVFWWGRKTLSPTANRILLIGMGVGFFVQCLAIFIIVQPLGNGVYESFSPALTSIFPDASATFIMTVFRSGIFAVIGGVTGLAVIAWQMQNATNVVSDMAHTAPSARTDAAAQETPARGIVERIKALPTANLYVLCGISWTVASCFVDMSALSLYFASEDFRLQFVGVIAAIGALLLDVLGAWVLGLAVSRRTPLNRTSYEIMILGALAASLVGIVSLIWQLGNLLVFGAVGLLVGGSIALALWSSNRQLPFKMLGIIAAGWLVGFGIQGAASALVFPSVTESIWEWIRPLEADLGTKPMFVTQIGIVGIFLGAIAPFIGIVFLDWQLRTVKQQNSRSFT